MDLFEVIVIEHPSKKEEKKGGRPQIIVGPKFVFAEDEPTASYETIVSHADELKDKDSNRVEVRIRPF